MDFMIGLEHDGFHDRLWNLFVRSSAHRSLYGAAQRGDFCMNNHSTFSVNYLIQTHTKFANDVSGAAPRHTASVFWSFLLIHGQKGTCLHRSSKKSSLNSPLSCMTASTSFSHFCCSSTDVVHQVNTSSPSITSGP